MVSVAHLGGEPPRKIGRDGRKREFDHPHSALTHHIRYGLHEVYCGLAYDPDDYGEGAPILVAIQRHAHAKAGVTWMAPSIAFLREVVVQDASRIEEVFGRKHYLPESDDELQEALWFLH